MKNLWQLLKKLPGVRDGLVVLDHGHGLTGQDGLINSQGGGEDSDNSDIGGDFVTDWKWKNKIINQNLVK